MRYESTKMTDVVLQWGKSLNFHLKNRERKSSREKKRNQNSLWSRQSQKENLIFVNSLSGRLFYSRNHSLSYPSSVLSQSLLWSQKLVEDKMLVLSKCIVTSGSKCIVTFRMCVSVTVFLFYNLGFLQIGWEKKLKECFEVEYMLH